MHLPHYSVLDVFAWSAFEALAPGYERSCNSQRFLSGVLSLDRSCHPGYLARTFGNTARKSISASGPEHAGCSRVNTVLLKLLDLFNTSVTWETGRNDVAAAGRMAHAMLANIFHRWRSRSGLSNCSSF
jgi:hypothetical protein